MPQDRSNEIKVDSVGKTACPNCGTVVDASAAPAFSTVMCPNCGAAFTGVAEADVDIIPLARPAPGLGLGKILRIAVALAVVCVAVWAMFFRGGAQPAPVAPPEQPTQTLPRKVARPTFPSRRRTAEGNIDVIISCRTSDAEIHYTIDGSEPTRKSESWKGRLVVAPGATLSARAFLDGWRPSEITRIVIGRDEMLRATASEIRSGANAAWQSLKSLDSHPYIKARLERCVLLYNSAANLYDKKAYASAKIAYEKLLALCLEIRVAPLVRLAAIYARQSAESAIMSVPGFGDPDAPAEPWKRIAAGANEAEAAFDREDFVKARDLWTQVAVEISKRRPAAATDVSEHQGFILAWFGAGPYTVADTLGMELFDVPFGPEENDENVAWRPLLYGMDTWGINLDVAIANGDNRAAYVRTRVHSPAEQLVRLELGSNDAIKAWLNGKQIHGKNGPRDMKAGQDVVSVKLSAGWNDLMLKVIDHEGGWTFCCRIRKPDGTALNGLKIEAK